MTIEFFGLGDQFTLKEAFDLLNSHVARKGEEKKAETSIQYIGFVAGLLTLNDEVEVVIKFPKEMVQLTKTAFFAQMTLLEMP